MEGWIRLHRGIKEHWIWKSYNRFHWWVDILLTVNHSDNKVLIKGNLIECKRGQSVRSLETWAKDWNVTKGAVRDFFKLLESDGMITSESLQFTTRITVTNYDSYQSELHVKETQKKRKGNDEGTQTIMNKNDKNDKNDNNTWRTDFEIYKSELFSVYQSLLIDKSFITERQKFHPTVDIALSLEKAVTDYWAKEEGWIQKKKSKSDTINWKSTLIKALDMPFNQVKKQRSFESVKDSSADPLTFRKLTGDIK